MEQEQLKQFELFVRLGEMIAILEPSLLDFEVLFGNKEIIRLLPKSEEVYTHTIVMYLGKIFSKSPNEHFSLGKFKSHMPKIAARVDQIFDKHKDIIGKIQTNRDKLFAHTDKKFINLGFSQEYVDDLSKQLWNADYSSMVASSKDQERYVPMDLHADLEEVKKMVQEIKELLKDAHNLIFPQSRTRLSQPR